jgi:hypothetical protein
MIDKELVLIHDIFGTDLDTPGVIFTMDSDKDGQRCRSATAKAIGKCQDAKLASYNRCKKDQLKAGVADAAALQDACMGTGTGPERGIPDTKGKIGKKCGNGLGGTLGKKCGTTYNDALFPPCTGQILADCIDQKIECRVCEALNALDGLARDCDQFDDGEVDDSCSSPTRFCGDGVVNQPVEECDPPDDSACPGRCEPDCTCALPTDLPRDSEPIVVSGDDLPTLEGTDPGDIFVFRLDTGAGWQQIAHQVDERQMTPLWSGASCPAECELRYVFSGTEANGLDDDDEVVFMAADVGEMASGSQPGGVSGSGYEVTVSFPEQGIVGYAYVFASSTLSKDFGSPLVSYTRTQIDPDTEDTDVATSQYHLHFSRLWVIDAIEVLAGGGGDGVDLLDRWKGRAYWRSVYGETEDIVGMCGGWSNHDPDWGVHIYLGHIDGPVRAIRLIQGACSWPNLTRVDVFYRGMAQMILNIRGHSFAHGEGGIWAYWDYEHAALPMTYYNPLLPNGTIIDGSNDPNYPNGDNGPEITSGWDQVDSAHGGIVFVVQETIDVPGPIKASIWDDVGYDDGTGENPPGDPGVIGGNGYHVLYIDNTDPALGGTPAQVVLHYWPLPANSGKMGESYAHVAVNPVTYTVSPY